MAAGSLVGFDDGLKLRDTDGLALGPAMDSDGRLLGDLDGFAIGLSVGDIGGTPLPPTTPESYSLFTSCRAVLWLLTTRPSSFLLVTRCLLYCFKAF